MIKRVKSYKLEENSLNLTYRNTQAGQNAPWEYWNPA